MVNPFLSKEHYQISLSTFIADFSLREIEDIKSTNTYITPGSCISWYVSSYRR